MVLFSVVIRRGSASTAAGKYMLRQVQVPAMQQRNFMSTQALSFAEEESRMLLILGKPGGGKGTISGKILEVCSSKLCSICQ
jgi:DNA replication protein DnaC